MTIKKTELYEALALFALRCHNTRSIEEQDEVISNVIIDLEIPYDPDCEYCEDTGEISEDETDESGNVARGTLTRKCICRTPEDDGNDYDQDR